MIAFNAGIVFILVLLSFKQVCSRPATLPKDAFCSLCPTDKISSPSERECYKVPEGRETHWCCKCEAGTFLSKPCRFADPLATVCLPCPVGTYTPGYNNQTECSKLPLTELAVASVNNSCLKTVSPKKRSAYFPDIIFQAGMTTNPTRDAKEIANTVATTSALTSTRKKILVYYISNRKPGKGIGVGIVLTALLLYFLYRKAKAACQKLLSRRSHKRKPCWTWFRKKNFNSTVLFKNDRVYWIDMPNSSYWSSCDCTAPEQLERIIDQKLSTPATKTKVIGQKGGDIFLQGCRLEVPPLAYEELTRMSISVSSSGDIIPLGCTPISPEVECKSDFPFNGLVSITLPVHILPEKSDAVEIINKKDTESDWEILSTEITIEDRCVKFKVPHFTKFWAIVRGLQFWRTFLSHSLYFNSETSSLYALTCIDTPSVIEGCDASLLEEGFRKAVPLPSKMALSSGNNMSYKYECKTPEECRVDPGGTMELTALSFSGCQYHIKSFSLEPKPDAPQIKLRYLLSTPQIANDESVITIQWNDGGARPAEPLGACRREDAAARPEQNIRPSTREFINAELYKDGNYTFDLNRTKGVVLIINNEFRGQGNAERTGSLIDVQNLTNLCTDLGLDVTTKNNLTADQMREACREFFRNAQNVNLMILVIMSHGGKRDGSEFFNGEDGNTVSSDEVIFIFSSLNSPHLEGIPKVFVFQACRGDEAERGLEEPLVERDAGPGTRINQGRSDMLFVYPSQHGYAAFRHRINGSWLINILVQVFKEHAHNRHVVDMLTMVNREISRIESEGGDIQRSNYLSFLRHDLYLFPGWPN